MPSTAKCPGKLPLLSDSISIRKFPAEARSSISDGSLQQPIVSTGEILEETSEVETGRGTNN